MLPLHYNNKMFSCYVKNLPAILLASRNRMFYSIDFLKNNIAKAGIRTIMLVHKAKNGSVVYYKSACKSMLTLLNSKGFLIRKSSL